MIKFVTPEVQGHRKYRLDNQQDLLEKISNLLFLGHKSF